MVGGSTRFLRASTVLISPASPAAVLAWPIIDFTDPTAQNGRCRSGRSKTRFMALISERSPTAVPVAWASTSPTVDGSMQASS